MSCDTIPTPPPTEVDTGRVPRETTSLVNTYLAVVALKSQVDAIALNLQGQVDGLGVDVAQSQAGELRTNRALKAIADMIEAQGVETSRQIGELRTMVATYAEGRMEDAHRIVVLEKWRREQTHTCECRHDEAAQ